LRRNQAHEQSVWATVAQLNVEIKRDARKDKKKALINTLEQCQNEKEKWESPKLLKPKNGYG
jgi:NADH:ubiquinone oxidoreductase subunit E